MEITRIVITGGPCAGKSEAMPLIKETFSQKGYTVLFIPETATELIPGGVCPWTCGTNLDYQKIQCKLQKTKEDLFDEAAKTMKQDKFLIVCDRGMLDNRSYMTQAEFEQVMEHLDMTEAQMNARYDAVFHLVTTAKGLEDFYSLENNVARYETAEQAAALDDRLIQAWSNHPNHFIIENYLDIHQKMDVLLHRIAEFLKVEL
ncbi:MAG: ATP-binding protein [Erysipelotrichaceae bacterium]|nr:ATP-binding protein [Erysipelotrichaceae bacterium]